MLRIKDKTGVISRLCLTGYEFSYTGSDVTENLIS